MDEKVRIEVWSLLTRREVRHAKVTREMIDFVQKMCRVPGAKDYWEQFQGEQPSFNIDVSKLRRNFGKKVTKKNGKCVVEM